MSLLLKAAKAIGTGVTQLAQEPGVRSALSQALAARGISIPGVSAATGFATVPGGGARMPRAAGGPRRRGRGISATELRGFRKVASLLDRHFRAAPAALKRAHFGRRRKR